MTERWSHPQADRDATAQAVWAWHVDVAALRAGLDLQADQADAGDAQRRLVEALGEQP